MPSPNKSYSKIMLKKKTTPKVGGEVSTIARSNDDGQNLYSQAKKAAATEKARPKYPKVYQNSLGNPLTEREKKARAVHVIKRKP